ncbi:hypothetical protein EV694_1958 [Volucribacter psittacicida]|uniref:DUF7210 domain-containing protein n=1 Tax=Volucribacter psittacicida TaxID=203482 RepID=A0A4V2PB36_9PAST|nr:hypothetical protein [Volucribacter psittacicida]TCJ95955.1 hypothetical protein EV694_1958 [Volucribacter psittacicida]
MKNYIVTASMAILHNGKRYEQGDQIELTPQQADKLALYVELDQEAEKAQQAEAKRLEAERKAKEKVEKQAQTKKNATKQANATEDKQ